MACSAPPRARFGPVRDMRVEAPYGAYTQFPISAVTETNGDLEARFVVRLKELLVTCFAIRKSSITCPKVRLTVKMPRKIPAGETIHRVEAPRGELFYYIKSNGGENPPARSHPHAQPMQLGLGARKSGRAPTGGCADVDRRHGPVLLVQ